jgi:hypothetical protein
MSKDTSNYLNNLIIFVKYFFNLCLCKETKLRIWIFLKTSKKNFKGFEIRYTFFNLEFILFNVIFIIYFYP